MKVETKPKSERRKWLEKHGFATWPNCTHITASRPVYEKYEVDVTGDVVHSIFSVTPTKLQLLFDGRDVLNLSLWIPVWTKSRFVKYEESDLEWALPLGFTSLTKASQVYPGSVVRVSDYITGFDCKAFVENVVVDRRSGAVDVDLSVLS